MSGVIGRSPSTGGVLGSSTLDARSSALAQAAGFDISAKDLWIGEGIGYISLSLYRTAGVPSHNATVCSITNSNWWPISNTVFPQSGYQDDYGNHILLLSSNGEFRAMNPANLGDTTWYFAINGTFRFQGYRVP